MHYWRLSNVRSRNFEAGLSGEHWKLKRIGSIANFVLHNRCIPSNWSHICDEVLELLSLTVSGNGSYRNRNVPDIVVLFSGHHGRLYLWRLRFGRTWICLQKIRGNVQVCTHPRTTGLRWCIIRSMRRLSSAQLFALCVGLRRNGAVPLNTVYYLLPLNV